MPKVIQQERQHHFHVEEVVDVPMEQHVEQVVQVPVVSALPLRWLFILILIDFHGALRQSGADSAQSGRFGGQALLEV